MKPSKDPNMTNEYRIGMLSAYALSLVAIFLPLLTVSQYGETMSVSFMDFFTSKIVELSLDESIVMVIRGLILFFAVIAIVFITLFLLDVTSRAKEGVMLVTAMTPMGVYGAMVLMGVAAKTYVMQMGVSDGSIRVGLGAILGWIAYLYIFYRTLVYLCRYKTSVKTPTLREEIAPVVKKAQEMVPAFKAKGQIKGVSGAYAGQVIPMEDGERIVFGRSAQECNLIVEGTKVSRKHCALVYHKAKGTYTLEDFSSNGTFKRDGSKYGRVEELVVDSVFYLGNKENGFQVK